MTRIKVVFDGGTKDGVKFGTTTTFTTLEDYKKRISPTLYAAIVHDLEKYGVYQSETHRVKYI